MLMLLMWCCRGCWLDWRRARLRIVDSPCAPGPAAQVLSRAHQAPFCARELLKTGAVSENAPGAHRDVPRDGECSTDGRRTRTVISNFESPNFHKADSTLSQCRARRCGNGCWAPGCGSDCWTRGCVERLVRQTLPLPYQTHLRTQSVRQIAVSRTEPRLAVAVEFREGKH